MNKSNKTTQQILNKYCAELRDYEEDNADDWEDIQDDLKVDQQDCDNER